MGRRKIEIEPITVGISASIPHPVVSFAAILLIMKDVVDVHSMN
jgi:hypothetical protein